MNRNAVAALATTTFLVVGCGGAPEAEHVDRQSGIPDAPLSYPGAGGPVPDNARPIPDDQEHRR